MENQEKQIRMRIQVLSVFSPLYHLAQALSSLLFSIVACSLGVLRVLVLKYKVRTGQDMKRDNVVMSRQ